MTIAWRGVLIALVVSAIVAEFVSAVGLKFIGRPIYWAGENRPSIRQAPPRTEKDPWGAWGSPTTTSRLAGGCFDVEYKFNSVGARDKEREIKSSRRWIVLGDSMTEGYGIEQSERFTSILEESLGWEFANFASAGDLGPLQYLLVYRYLAKQFEHQGVIVGLLPFNDFTDNDSEYWKLKRSRHDQTRYRPYSVLDNLSYRIMYGTDGKAVPRNDLYTRPESPKPESWARALSRVSATFSLLRQLISELSERKAYVGGYFTVDQRQIVAVQLALDDLSREVGRRPKIILLLPMHIDLVERRRGVSYSDQIKRFVDALRSDGWTIIDLADALTDETRDITLGCDGHWNAATNRKVAEYLLIHYRQYLNGATSPRPDP